MPKRLLLALRILRELLRPQIDNKISFNKKRVSGFFALSTALDKNQSTMYFIILSLPPPTSHQRQKENLMTSYKIWDFIEGKE